MKISGYGDLPERTGDVMMIYGEAGVGKSVSTIQTADLPMIYIMTEPRDVKKFVIASGRAEAKEQVDFAFYEGYEGLIEFVCDESAFEKYKTIVLDSISHLIAINLSDEILDESYESANKKKSEDKPLTMRAKMSQEGYGTLGSSMLRFTQALAKLSQQGRTIVCLARTESNPKYNRNYSTGPALKGQEYSKHFAGFFDFIGLVEQRSKDGKVVYPPAVSFESDGSFLAKWTGAMPPSGVVNRPLNISRILKASHEEANGAEK
jgi:hypothetical protein